MDWPIVVLILGVLAFAFGVMTLRSKARDSMAAKTEAELKAGLVHVDARQKLLDEGLSRVESLLKLDGRRAMTEAARRNLPPFMT